MKIVIFGLTISSSWGNGHATLWRGLCRALAGRGHDIVFFERDTAWYAMIDKEWPALARAYDAWLDPTNFDGDGRQKRRLEDLRSAFGA